eukprot:TRINITY_DN11612_c0_g1_i1.p2 TRINITY_DN11612_c0_g1~~TRINITY_DN11612_c0_g1_i1.p2  ORF type:complete len:370 (+),score=146.31 TRINITY_DN11612_c0_g1_i1:120-1229(+)
MMGPPRVAAGKGTPRKPARKGSPARRRDPGQGVVENTVGFADFALPDEDAELEAENKLLSWKVKQLFTTGENYRQKVEAMYKDGQARLAELARELDAAAALKQEADDAALEAASQLALANEARTKLTKEQTAIKTSHAQLATRLSESKEVLQQRGIDAAVAEAEADKVDAALSKSTARVAHLEQQLAAVRQRRRVAAAEQNENDERRAAYAKANDVLQSELAAWRQNCDAATTGVRTLVAALTAAAKDCKQVSQTAAGVGTSMEGMDALVEPASPLRVEDSRPEIAALKETRAAFVAEAQEIERSLKAKDVATGKREANWSALTHEWKGWGNHARTHQQIVRKQRKESTSPHRRRASPGGGSPKRAEWR